MELEPCPFCGEKEEHENVAADSFDEWSDFVVRCSNCGAKGPPCSMWPEAEKSWNKRVE